jgi:hypothetical protein
LDAPAATALTDDAALAEAGATQADATQLDAAPPPTATFNPHGPAAVASESNAAVAAADVDAAPPLAASVIDQPAAVASASNAAVAAADEETDATRADAAALVADKPVNTAPADDAVVAAVDAPAVAASEEAATPNVPAPDAAAVPATLKRDDSKKFEPDMSYINHRTKDVDRTSSRRSLTGDSSGVGVGGAGEMSARKLSVKDTDGKWKVDTSYIDTRTKQVGQLERQKNWQYRRDQRRRHGNDGVECFRKEGV